ncbi:hypothetical protein FDA94_16480 [Herbidospora galbida]|uniref:Oxidoreductase n=1 Tax=Herbidospora galbida TaxID=2575442 RepID=A0A4U3MH09_9ACTN|nr:hypothetical protein [Herbidospora galbida]TKK87772.1 hypothetical protein FDA94_16480 [Herbidospora galbida]
MSAPADWSPAEQRLWTAFTHGTQLDLGGLSPVVGSPNGEYWGEDQIIRAEALAHLLIHGPEQEPGKPPRLILKGARITGRFDAGCAELASFLFIECVFDQTPFMNDAKLQFMGFQKCRLPGLDAARIRCDGPVWLDDTRFFGPVVLEDTEIGGDLRIKATTVDAGHDRVAIQLDAAHVANHLVLHGARTIGAISMVNLRADGNLVLRDAHFDMPGGWAVHAPRLVVGGSVFGESGIRVTGGVMLGGSSVAGEVLLDRIEISRPLEMALDLDHSRFALGFKCLNGRIHGAIRLHHMIVGCQVDLQNTRITQVKKGVDAVRADHLEVDGTAVFADVDLDGPLNLHGAKIACNLILSGAKLRGVEKQAAFNADGARIGNHLIARDCTADGGVVLTAAEIEGNTNFIDATLRNGAAVAFDLRRAILKGSLQAGGSLTVTGTMALTNASVGVDLVLRDATLTNPRGKAMAATGLQVAGDLIADRCTTAGLIDLAGSAIKGDLRLVDAELKGLSADEASRGTVVDPKGEWRGLAVRCTGARVDGDVDLRGAQLHRELGLNGVNVGRTVRIEGTHLAAEGPSALTADGLVAETLVLKPAAPPVHAVSLASAHVTELVDGAASWPSTAPINLSGFHYERLDSDLPVEDRLNLLRRATPVYAAGPYEKLAACLELAGQDADARVVRHASIRRSYQAKNPVIRLWGNLQDLVVGYGYAPGRALAISVLLLLGAGLWFTVGVTGCLPASPGLCPVKADEHPTWDAWLYSLDLLIPLVDLGHEKAWDPLGVSKLVALALTMSGWVLTTVVIAAAGRTLRRS